MGNPATATRRERHRQATLDEIVSVSRELLTDPAGLSLRAVAQRMGITPPALYRYVDNYQDLLLLVAADIDRDTAAVLREARDSQPADDPLARLLCAAIAFRRWALGNREEFSLVFANPATSSASMDPEVVQGQETGNVFTDLLVQVWLKYDFPLPDTSGLDEEVRCALQNPVIPADLTQIPDSARGLVWLFMQSWVALYGTVTLEVFGHCDPRVIHGGALFRAMLAEQAVRLDITAELPRMQPLIDRELAR